MHLSPSGLGPACFLSHSVPIDDLYLGRSFYIIVTVKLTRRKYDTFDFGGVSSGAVSDLFNSGAVLFKEPGKKGSKGSCKEKS